jgi:hypothetical protein
MRGGRTALAALTAAAFLPPAALADPYVVGDRLFPSTLLTEDPFVADEASFGVGYARHGATLDSPATRETDLSFGLDKRLTDDLGISLDGGYSLIPAAEGGSAAYGFANLALGLKYQFLVNDAHELLLSAGLEREFGGSGAARVGAEPLGSTSAVLYAGKGMGDLPDGLAYLRPLAVTGSVELEIPDGDHHSALVRGAAGSPMLDIDQSSNRLQMGIAVEYSLRYLEGNVAYLGLPSAIDRLVPLVELNWETPAGRSYGDGPAGTLAPGVIYVGHSFELGIEATVPLNRAAGTNVGVLAQLTLRLEEILPDKLTAAPF